MCFSSHSAWVMVNLVQPTTWIKLLLTASRPERKRPQLTSASASACPRQVSLSSAVRCGAVRCSAVGRRVSSKASGNSVGSVYLVPAVAQLPMAGDRDDIPLQSTVPLRIFLQQAAPTDQELPQLFREGPWSLLPLTGTLTRAGRKEAPEINLTRLDTTYQGPPSPSWKQAPADFSTPI